MTKPKKPVEPDEAEIPFYLRSDLFFEPGGGVRHISDPFPIVPAVATGTGTQRRTKPLKGKQRRLRVRAPGQDYTVTELAHEWGLSTDKIRELFRNEPGVTKLEDKNAGKKRKRHYVTLRIPEDVAKRVKQRMS